MKSASSRRGVRRTKNGNRTAGSGRLDAQARAKKPDRKIDLSDIPEVFDWDEAERAKFYRPEKLAITIRLDCDVLAWFRSRGDGYQTRINEALRDYVLAHKHK